MAAWVWVWVRARPAGLCSLSPLCFTAALIKAKIVTKIKACISVLKCTEEASLLKEEGCGDEEQQLIRPRLKPQVESISNAAVSFVDLSVSPTSKTYKTVKYKTSTFSSIILKRRQTPLQLTAEATGRSRSLNLLTLTHKTCPYRVNKGSVSTPS